MPFRAVLTAMELLDSATVDGHEVAACVRAAGLTEVEVIRLASPIGGTDVVRILVPGRQGRRGGGTARTLGIVGHLGGIGARPDMQGLVSDADGAVAAIACALELARMAQHGDALAADVMIATHICPDAPIFAHPTVLMVDPPIAMATLNREEARPEMDAILVVDTTRGNRVVNHRGIALSPTVKEGWILRVSEDLLTIMQNVTGRMPVVLPLTMQDITPYDNGLFHLNSIAQPGTATSAPVVGVALTAEVPVPGTATGASQPADIELAVRFCLEVAKSFGSGACHFHDAAEWVVIQRRYGSMAFLQTQGRA